MLGFLRSEEFGLSMGEDDRRSLIASLKDDADILAYDCRRRESRSSQSCLSVLSGRKKRQQVAFRCCSAVTIRVGFSGLLQSVVRTLSVAG